MAKAKVKSIHSRAARRAASPSLDLDKSLTSLPRAEGKVVEAPAVLTERAKAGVSKKQLKPRNLSRAQKLRQQKSMDRAEAVMDQLETKVTKSVKREKTVKARRGDWEDTNRKASKFAALQTQSTGDDGDDDGDAMVDDSTKSQSKVTVLTPASNPNPQRTAPVINDHADVDNYDDIT
ncbi:hypothetical protein ASPZODRAFT_148450 [Penicilliopsis zonata CBS 506.65]|uniref:Ribosome biogenesis protein Alb1 n=1 Tax=Penicilliopsis zonata CBS 506.65 TaxID=1073090 RepID=A0A1L9SV42_9EURO|nr:hypothetical protein ASPZODRAFT_148450 [Penicilliopsis zonata CBS 506.65]OJJ51090.1 hypothetical protein ASPZODRAFT_148450 [Penicilliopsis zonata CBS 506.65]